MKNSIFPIIFLFIIIGCTSPENSSPYESLGSIEVLDERLNSIIDPEAEIEILATGFSWSEGPVWVPELNKLLFSDVPENKIYSWNEEDSIQLFLDPSGHTGFAPSSATEGANGLALDNDGKLLLSQHGDRRIARLNDFEIKDAFVTLAQFFNGNRFNSPNDIVVKSDGAFFFTDPPYGLAGQDADSLKELSYNGVFLLSDTEVSLIDSTLTRPNGVALSPDEKTLVVANSDPEIAIWRKYDVAYPSESTLLFDATSMVKDRPGLPDGLKINMQGIVFATGPGGVLILTLEGHHLGTILTNKPTANCALSPDEKTLYMTADDMLLRVALK